MKIRLSVAYDGTKFCGWQRQNHGGPPSVQETLEKGIGQLFQQKITLFGSGRTDAGVHALNQHCHFTVDVPEARILRQDICWALKGILPPEIAVRKAWIAPDEFHSTLSATHKIYRYYIYNHPRSNPFLRHTSTWMRRPVNLEHLQESVKHVVGRHDFKSFQSAGTDVKTTVRTIYKATWERKTENMVQFSIDGQGFLKQMVRNIVGTQLLLEKSGRDPAEMAEILRACDRSRAGAPAPAQGLFLWKVFYPRELDKKCRPL